MFAIVLRFLVTVAAIPLCAHYMDGVYAPDMNQALMLGAILAAIYLVLRPVMRLILAVFNFCTLGILNVILDAWLVWTISDIMGKSVRFANFGWAVAVAMAITALRLVVDILTGHLKK